MEELITTAQLSIIKNRVIWISIGHPSDRFMKWWKRQNPQEMEEKVNKLSKHDASVIISESLNYEWDEFRTLGRVCEWSCEIGWVVGRIY